MKKCDIIVPIYNAYECVIDCVDSIIKNTDLEENGLILIDDKSPDDRIVPLLKKYKKNYPSIEIMFNEENLGFVGTVNRGMKYSKNDVLLLNSDTEVTKNWLYKIKKCAYSSDYIATVTPLSNNATLASVPKLFEPNDIPEGFTLEEMAKLVEDYSYHDYPEIPTGHGFCLYIKREALEKVGYFDEEAFGKGYGEENDFCFRCLDYGYKHVLADDTYILHKESQSFTDSKIKLMENAGKILSKRYSEYSDRLSLWCARRPLQYIADNVAYAIGVEEQKSSDRKNILYVIHDWNMENLGGTTMHAYDLIKNLRKKYNFYVLVPENNVYKLYIYTEGTELVVQYPKSQSFSKINYYNQEYKTMVEEIIDDYKINLIHVHHLKGHYFDLGDIIEQKKIYAILSLHDLYSVCPLITKMYQNEEYCGKNPSITTCDKCLQHTMNFNNSIIQEYRTHWKKFIEKFAEVIVPSESTKMEINNHYKNIKLTVIEHGSDLKRENSKMEISGTARYYDVAIIGAIGIHKGSKIIEQLISKTKLGKIRIHLFGKFDSQLQKDTAHFKNHGKYKREELSEKLKENNIKLVCLFSICPETFSYTLSESIAIGIPVLSFDIGALGERVKKSNVGWTIPYTSTPNEIVSKINSIFKNQEEYQKKVKNIQKYHLKTAKEMAEEYHKLYNKKGIMLEKTNEKDIQKVQEKIKRSTEPTYNVSYANYAWVFDTLKWRIVSKIKLPQSVKKVIRKVKKT